MRLIALLGICLAMAGCATQSYRETPPAKFTGALDVRWVKNDHFLFVPNQEEPFALIRSDGSRIQPGPMLTDGGSIPHFLWGLEGYSPWGYAPAYIVHDWLFEAKQCGHEPDNRYTFEDTVRVMAEGLKAVMERFPEFRNYFVFDTVVGAVGTSIARRLWEGGSCETPALDPRILLEKPPPGELLGTIRF